MNRKHRRKSKQKHKIQNKFNNESMIVDCDLPCCYCNGNLVYTGAAVFLKQQNNIDDIYDSYLNYLIRKHHRFIILGHWGIKKGVALIVLLSTSKEINEKQRLGIKLNGVYNKTKDVYMDSTNCWLIDTEYIDSVDYYVDEDDKFKCVFNFFTNSTYNGNISKGTENNININNYYEKTKRYVNLNLGPKQLEVFKYKLIQDRVDRMTYDDMANYLQNLPEQVDTDLKTFIHNAKMNGELVLPWTEKDIETNEDTCKQALKSLTALSMRFMEVSRGSVCSKIQRGY